MTIKRPYCVDRMPCVLVKQRSQVGTSSYDDHVKAWRLVKKAKEENWNPARFLRASCEMYEVSIDKIYASYGGTQIAFVRFVTMNRAHAIYPRLSSTRLGEIFQKNHATVLFTLGRLQNKPTVLKR